MHQTNLWIHSNQLKSTAWVSPKFIESYKNHTVDGRNSAITTWDGANTL